MTAEQKETVTFDQLSQLDLRTGTITDVSEFPEAREPAYKLTIDFGEFGMKQSSAQITELYEPEDLTGTQIIAVVNFPPKRIASFQSEVLILGVYADGGVVLLRPDRPVADGKTIG